MGTDKAERLRPPRTHFWRGTEVRRAETGCGNVAEEVRPSRSIRCLIVSSCRIVLKETINQLRRSRSRNRLWQAESRR